MMRGLQVAQPEDQPQSEGSILDKHNLYGQHHHQSTMLIMININISIEVNIIIIMSKMLKNLRRLRKSVEKVLYQGDLGASLNNNIFSVV